MNLCVCVCVCHWRKLHKNYLGAQPSKPNENTSSLEWIFPPTTKIRSARETSFHHLWEAEKISKRNEMLVLSPIKVEEEEGEWMHIGMTALFGKFTLSCFLHVALRFTGKNTGFEKRMMFAALICLWFVKNGLWKAAVTHSATFILQIWVHICPHTHNVLKPQWRGKTVASGKVVLWEELTWFAGANCVPP